MSLNLQSILKLRDGNLIPIMGFGTYELDGSDAFNPVKWALHAGYRHIDSAAWYNNEKECGEAIRAFLTETGLERSAVFFTTKLKNNSTYDGVKAAIDRSLKECGFGYIDLYLLHSPIGGGEKRKESWGKREMIRDDVELPVINQVDLHPFMTRTDIVRLCKEHNIALEAWAPLVRGLRFGHPAIQGLASKYGKDPAQILLRYSVQKGYIPLPKSASKKRIESNTLVYDFELTDGEVTELDMLDEELVTDWDPTKCP